MTEYCEEEEEYVPRPVCVDCGGLVDRAEDATCWDCGAKELIVQVLGLLRQQFVRVLTARMRHLAKPLEPC